MSPQGRPRQAGALPFRVAGKDGPAQPPGPGRSALTGRRERTARSVFEQFENRVDFSFGPKTVKLRTSRFSGCPRSGLPWQGKPLRMTTLYLLCGKIAAGKSTLARRLAERPATLLITMDHWMSLLFPTENRTIEDFARLSARLRAAMGPHVVEILRHDLSVVLDFPANTVNWRSWMRSLITEADVAHELHVLDVPDMICKERLRRRNADGEHPYQVSEENYELFRSSGTRRRLPYRAPYALIRPLGP